MKKIGIIGGLSPESTVSYYKWLNEGVRDRLGGHHSAKILLSSVDFAEFCALKEAGDWDTQAELLADEAQALQRAGADFLILATNTMHKHAEKIESMISIPFLHLADATARRIQKAGLNAIALLGTRYTMELDFYKSRLIDAGIDVYVPDEKGVRTVNDIIYNELVKGDIRAQSRKEYQNIVLQLAEKGAQGVILGCTEITLLIGQNDVTVPVFDTTRIHVEEALEYAFGGLSI